MSFANASKIITALRSRFFLLLTHFNFSSSIFSLNQIDVKISFLSSIIQKSAKSFVADRSKNNDEENDSFFENNDEEDDAFSKNNERKNDSSFEDKKTDNEFFDDDKKKEVENAVDETRMTFLKMTKKIVTGPPVPDRIRTRERGSLYKP